MENHHAINGKIHYFDWAIFNSYVTNYQRVDDFDPTMGCSPSNYHGSWWFMAILWWTHGMEAFQLLRCVELLRACLLYKFLGEDLAKFNMFTTDGCTPHIDFKCVSLQMVYTTDGKAPGNPKDQRILDLSRLTWPKTGRFISPSLWGCQNRFCGWHCRGALFSGRTGRKTEFWSHKRYKLVGKLVDICRAVCGPVQFRGLEGRNGRLFEFEFCNIRW